MKTHPQGFFLASGRYWLEDESGEAKKDKTKAAEKPADPDAKK